MYNEFFVNKNRHAPDSALVTTPKDYHCIFKYNNKYIINAFTITFLITLSSMAIITNEFLLVNNLELYR